MIRRRLISILSAMALVFGLLTFLPEGAIMANAEKRLNIRVSYIAETGQIHLEWDPYVEGAAYTIYFYNECASGDNAGKMLEMGSTFGAVKKGDPCEYTTREGFGALYANGGMNYQVRIVVFDPDLIATVVYEEYSDVFQTGVPMLAAPQNVSMYRNGMLSWERDRKCWAKINIFDHETGKSVLCAETGYIYYDYMYMSDKIQPGKSYYATVQLMMQRPDYSYRESPVVYSNAEVYEKPTAILGLGWNDWKVSWAKYPGSYYHRVALQKQDPGGGYTDVYVIKDYYQPSQNDNSIILQRDMLPYVKKNGRGVYRVVIWAMSSKDEQISHTTVTEPFEYNLVGDVNDDGEVSLLDVVFLSRAVSGVESFKQYLIPANSFDGNDEVSRLDVVLLSRRVSKGSWDL